ncbi:MAG: 4-(cytidine 5'-diphospho)-2-C-methyl-D-erythritol kinase [Actinobacteria bacterium]|nr:MAG: 4-(cytidine 5'-diphospho)-2-C-methyl-D-erythritol kinase [Actinomycetota bacterium]
MSAYRALAPAKVNLGLFVGARRDGDGRHELVSVMQSISLADELTLAPAHAGADQDEIVCPGVGAAPQENLALRALRAFRAATGWRGPPLRLIIRKRIPVAAGLGGGSADAAAALRLARLASGRGDEALLLELAARLGADVPAQVSPGRWLATGAGERLERLPDPEPPLALLLLGVGAALSTAEVYERADALGPLRTPGELESLRCALRDALAHGEPLPARDELLANDLQPAAISLCPPIADALSQLERRGAERAVVSGSGPTVMAPGGASFEGAIACTSVDSSFARPRAL